MTVIDMEKMLAPAEGTLIGGSVEENPRDYKDIEEVIAAQSERGNPVKTVKASLV